jgi:DNA-directed RNA polymerase subunit RPC12/RpoP
MIGRAQNAVRRSNREGYLQTACARCRRKYRIRLAHIPENAQAFRCKQCGGKIRIPLAKARPADSPRASKPPTRPGRPRFRLDLMTPEKRPRPRGIIRNLI